MRREAIESPAAPPRPHAHRWRLPLLALGWTLIVLTPLVGILPGPGGVFVFAAGLVLLLRNSAWVRRNYVRVKRRWPRLGGYADRALRRPSERRRRLRRIDFEGGAA